MDRLGNATSSPVCYALNFWMVKRPNYQHLFGRLKWQPFEVWLHSFSFAISFSLPIGLAHLMIDSVAHFFAASLLMASFTFATSGPSPAPS
jgi:hypothetical protein